MQPHEKIKRACKQTHTTVQGFVRTSNSGAMNVNRFEQTVSELQTVVLRSDSSGDADNIKIKRNFFKKGFDRLSNSCAFYKHFRLTAVSASNPFLKKLL